MQKKSLTSIVSLPTPIRILDVGASFVGNPPPYQPLVDSGQATILGFEPDPVECGKLSARYGPPHAFFPHFAGDGKDAVFYQTNWAPTGSLFRPNREILEKFQNMHEIMTLVGEHPVRTVRIDDIAGMEPIDFMKLDVQGAELAVLQGAEQKLKHVSVIQVEVEFLEMYEKQPLFADVDSYLRSQGFVFHHFRTFGLRCIKPTVVDNDVNKGVSQLLWADAVYLRNWMRPDDFSVEQVLKMAVIAHDILGSIDVANHLLHYFDSVFGTNLSGEYMGHILAHLPQTEAIPQ